MRPEVAAICLDMWSTGSASATTYGPVHRHGLDLLLREEAKQSFGAGIQFGAVVFVNLAIGLFVHTFGSPCPLPTDPMVPPPRSSGSTPGLNFSACWYGHFQQPIVQKAVESLLLTCAFCWHNLRLSATPGLPDPLGRDFAATRRLACPIQLSTEHPPDCTPVFPQSPQTWKSR